MERVPRVEVFNGSEDVQVAERTQKVQRLRASIQIGTYKVDPERLAEKMLGHAHFQMGIVSKSPKMSIRKNAASPASYGLSLGFLRRPA